MLLLALCLILQFLTSIYTAVFTAVAVAVLFLSELPRWKERKARVFRDLLIAAGVTVAGILLGVALSVQSDRAWIQQNMAWISDLSARQPNIW